MDTNSQNQASATKSGIVAVRLSPEKQEVLCNLTGMPTPGKAILAVVQAVIDSGRFKPAIQPVPPSAATAAHAPTPPPAPPPAPRPEPTPTQAVTLVPPQKPAWQPEPLAAAAMPTGCKLTQDQVDELRNSHKVSEYDFRLYFKRMREHGGRDASEEIENEFWQYLVAADFNKMDGSPISKSTLPGTFLAWMRNRRKENAEAKAEQDAREAELADKAEREAMAEKMNDEWLRNGENYVDLDD